MQGDEEQITQIEGCKRIACEESKSNKSDRQNKAGCTSATGKAMLTSPLQSILCSFWMNHLFRGM